MAKDLNPLAAEKSRFRQLFKNQWDVMIESKNQKETLQQQLQNHLVDFLKNQSGTWCIYQALSSEINVQSVIQQTPHLRWAWPVVKEQSLQFYVPGASGFAKGKFGILEPVVKGALFVEPSDCSGFLVPGMGFDQSGTRLGKGLGFYDRALQGARGLKVGVCFSGFVVEKLPSDKWDIRMDVLATEGGILKVK